MGIPLPGHRLAPLPQAPFSFTPGNISLPRKQPFVADMDFSFVNGWHITIFPFGWFLIGLAVFDVLAVVGWMMFISTESEAGPGPVA
jgi:hypothetical protein